MAGNPLFTSVNQKHGLKPPQNDCDKSVKTLMTRNPRPKQSNVDLGMLDMEPPGKKPRLAASAGAGDAAGNADEMWDDNEDFFTEDQLEDMDIMASQALEQPSTSADLKTPCQIPAPTDSVPKAVPPKNKLSLRTNKPLSTHTHTHTHRQSGSEQNVTQASSISEGYHTLTNPTQNAPKVNYMKKRPIQTNVSHPLVEGQSSAFAAGLQGGVASRQDLIPTPGMTCSGGGRDSPALPGSHGKSEFSGAVEKRHKQLEEECAKYKEQVRKLKEEQYSKDGRIGVLQDNLKKKDNELSKQRQERLRMLDQQAREQTEREKSLKTEVERLRTQLQFKEREVVENETMYRKVEQKLQNIQAQPSVSGAACQQEHSPSSRSPKMKKQKVESSSPRMNKTNFPTKNTFLQDSPVFVGQTVKNSPVKADTTDQSASVKAGPSSTDSSPAVVKQLRKRRSLLNVRCTKGVSGAELVAKLVESESSVSSDTGIIALLQMPPPLVDISSTKLERDTSSDVLSPAFKSKRSKQGSKANTTMEQLSDSPGRAVVSEEHFSLAKQALKSLLDPLRRGASSQDSVSVLSTLLLPMLNDYLTVYVDMLETTVEPSAVSPGNSLGSGKSSSIESSLESLSSAVRNLMLESATYANDLEKRALNCLQILHKLVLYSAGIRLSLLANGESERISANMEGVAASLFNSKANVVPTFSASKTPLDGATMDTCCSALIGKVGPLLLNSVMRLANPFVGNNKPNSSASTETSLAILVSLSRLSDLQQLEKLKPLLVQGSLTSCFASNASYPVILQALQLLTALAEANVLVSAFCNQTDDCLLLAVYNVCVCEQHEGLAWEQRLSLYGQVVQLLSTIVATHKGGAILLLEADYCSMEIIKSLVLMLHAVLESYAGACGGEPAAAESLRVLRQGVTLLHTLSLRDAAFTEHHMEVEHQYITLVSGVRHLYKALPGITDEETLDVQDLCDFDNDDQEDDDGQDDEEEDDPMETE